MNEMRLCFRIRLAAMKSLFARRYNDTRGVGSIGPHRQQALQFRKDHWIEVELEVTSASRDGLKEIPRPVFESIRQKLYSSFCKIRKYRALHIESFITIGDRSEVTSNKVCGVFHFRDNHAISGDAKVTSNWILQHGTSITHS